jgi:hypothetical protein
MLALLALAAGGCTTTGKHWWSPATWGSSRPAEQAAKAETKLDASQDKAVRAARAEVSKAGIALASAPESRPVEVSRRTIGNAQVLLDQVAGPLTAEESADIRRIVADLLSDNAAIRAAAEAKQATAEERIATLSRDLATAGAALDKANTKLAAAFARENELADQLRNERARRAWIISGGSLLVLVLGAGWLWVQIASGGIPRALGSVLKGLDEKSPEQANAIRNLLDPVLNRIEQAAIRKHA